LTTGPALVVAWQAPPEFAAARSQILNQAKARMELGIGDGVTIVGVPITPATTIGVVASPRANPHVDSDFPEWSALWVLQSCGHQLGIADHRPANPSNTTRRPLRSPGLAFVPLLVDGIVLFNAHRTHWMDAVPSRPRPVMFAASFDFATRPSREHVEERIRMVIQPLLGP
jgi:hypothetical protein